MRRVARALRGRGVVLPCLLVLAAGAGCQREESAAVVARQIETLLTGDGEAGVGSSNDPAARVAAERVGSSLQRFYLGRRYAPAWGLAAGERAPAEELLAAIAAAPAEGLEPSLYDLEGLRAELAALDRPAEVASPAGGAPDEDETPDEDTGDPEVERSRRLAALDLRLSRAFLRYGEHLMSGRLDPAAIGLKWDANPRTTDLAGVLEEAIASGKVQAALAGLVPPHPQYVELGEALAHYRRVQEHGGWPRVPEVDFGPGETGPEVALLRARLVASGDLPADAAAPPTAPFDPPLEAALARFQRRLGLAETGRVDAATRAALNVPVAARIEQIALNMERWRWLPRELGERYVLVNIPDFRLKIVEHGDTVLSMRVVVGKTYQQTPVFSDEMTYLVMNPHWNVPPGIARNEILPAVMADPAYLTRQNMEVVRGWRDEEGGEPMDPATIDWASVSVEEIRFRQRPGGGNSLGQIKFMFPNEHNVYLHDTPAGQLFERSERSFSHGCIRVERPLDLAAYILRSEPAWTPAAIAAAVDGGEQRSVRLPEPIPVHILYWTAWVGDDGVLHLRDDVYGHDATLVRALAATEGGRRA